MSADDAVGIDGIAPTLATRREADSAFHAEHLDIILKPLDGKGGMAIFRVRPDGLNLASSREPLRPSSAETVMVQRYLPAPAADVTAAMR